MSKIALLDCTLRDGGYINNWNFGQKEIKHIVSSLANADIEIIEVGFLTDLTHTKNQSLYGNCHEIDDICTTAKNSMFAAMIALGEKEISPKNIAPKKDCKLDIIRITFHSDNDEIQRAIDLARLLMDKGYKVCMQPIGTASYTDSALIELIDKINLLHPYAFYIVDTLGAFYNEDLLRLIYITDHNLHPEIKLGFHSHNNLQMSFSNAQKIIELHSSREFLLDSSLFGMGRGAGNLCTELIAKYTNSIGISAYNMINILDSIENYIYPIYAKTNWGYNIYYYVAATHKCHPNYASYLMKKQTLTVNQVNLLLSNLPKNNRHIFNQLTIEALYQNLQNCEIDDLPVMKNLSSALSNKTVLLLAPGSSISKNFEKIKAFITENAPIVISVNTNFSGISEDYIFISNNKRMLSLDYDTCNGKIIVTSNLPVLNNNFLSVSYKKLCDYSFEEPDNAGMMILRLLMILKASKVYLAGFDGFEATIRSNYYTDKILDYLTAEEAQEKNISICRQLKSIKNNLDIEFLTPSIYQRIENNEI